MIIRQIKKSDEKKLCDFLLKLSRETLYNWNRFGTKITKKNAAKISREQANKPIREEKGFVTTNENGDILGYGFLRYFPDKKQKIFNASLGMAIADDFQGQGLGKKLIKHLIDFSVKKKTKKIWLTVYADNARAIKLYKKYGFEVEGIFMYDEYFGGKPRHIASMAKFLDKEIKNTGPMREELIKDLLK